VFTLNDTLGGLDVTIYMETVHISALDSGMIKSWEILYNSTRGGEYTI
jgi:hypothetical protein